MMKCLQFLIVFVVLISCTNGVRILGIFTTPLGSHYILGSTLMKALAEKGHDVTLVTGYKGNKVENVRHVIIDGVKEQMEAVQKFYMEKERSFFFMVGLVLENFVGKINEAPLLDKNFQEIMKNEKFDLIIIEFMLNEFMLGLSHHFKAPSIFLSTSGSQVMNHRTGNLAPPSFVPNALLGYHGTMTFMQRVVNTLAFGLAEAIFSFNDYVQSKTYRKYFENGPELNELTKNISLYFINGHVCFEPPGPYLPNTVPIGGYHVGEPKELPKDLQEFLDNAKDGVIYFSLGSNLQSKDMPDEQKDILLNTFKKFPQKVLWKFEDDDLKGKPENVKIGKWLPQSDILAHPNVRVFISHGGLLSTTEAVYRGVPIIGIPFYGDQYANVQYYANAGYGLMMVYSELSEDTLTEALNEILNNPKYSENVKRTSRIIQDQPDKPLDRAVFWIEHILKFGADHLKTSALDLNFIQYFSLDVFAFLLGVLVIFVGVFYITCRFLCCRKKTGKLKEN